jgi:hypothetical protein
MLNSRSQSLSGCGRGGRFADRRSGDLAQWPCGGSGMLWRLQILRRPTSDKPSFGASFESASSQTVQYNFDRSIFFFGFIQNFTSTFEKPGGCITEGYPSGSRVMNTARSDCRRSGAAVAIFSPISQTGFSWKETRNVRLRWPQPYRARSWCHRTHRRKRGAEGSEGDQ